MSDPDQFDSDWYLAHNLDVAAAGVDAYQHFLVFGLTEGRTTATFNEAYYLARYPDVAQAVAQGHLTSGWEHFITFGDGEGRNGSGPVYMSGVGSADSFGGTAYADGLRIKGGYGSDSLTGSNAADILYGNQNSDLIIGNAADDTLFGGQNDGPAGDDGVLRVGTDTLSGGAGNDLVYGNHGADSLLGGAGNDSLYGGQDNDILADGLGSDLVYGNRGDDVIDLDSDESAFDTVYGGDGADSVDGGRNSLVYGDAGDDHVSLGWIGGGEATLYGGSGADTLEPDGRIFGIRWEDFDPDEGDRISDTYIADATIAFDPATGAVTFTDLVRRVSVTVYLGRSDFSEDWLV